MDLLDRPSALRRIFGRIPFLQSDQLQGDRWLRRWAVATLIANMVIVLTGALVRLTDSGLGCPTWPKCTDQSYVPHAALGAHGVIEFGNRLLTFVLIAVAVLTWLTAMLHRDSDGRPRRDLIALTTALAVGIPAQGIVGGFTVLSQLNPFVVAFHLLVSLALIVFAVVLIYRVFQLKRAPRSGLKLILPRITFGLMCVVVWLGTVVTGSGPHSGDRGAVRTGFDAELVSHIHAYGVYAAVAATIGCVILLRNRAAVYLLIMELLQGVIGFTQYYNGLPIPLVAAHLIGAAVAIALATNLLLSVRQA